MTDDLVWTADDRFTIGPISFECALYDRFVSEPDRFCIIKPRKLVEQYRQLFADLAPKRIIELGINRGGSTAMLAALTHPEVLVAVDVLPDRVEALDRFLEAQGLAERSHVHWGIDQGDRPTLARLVDDALAGEPLDLIIDDASHDLELSRASFEVLFPRLRPGGVYVLEDWAWAHVSWNATRPHDTPLTVLPFEFVVALPQTDGLIDKIEIDRHWVLVRKGELELPHDGFAIADWYAARGKDLIAPLADAPPGRMITGEVDFLTS
jgi:predicted O-methyltransferase YrrM